MEALALGRPVITTYVAGIPELVQPGVSGWLVPAGSVEALAEAIREALATPTDLLTWMGLAGAERVAAAHDVTREAAALAALFPGPRQSPGMPPSVGCTARAAEVPARTTGTELPHLA
jgi:glycosyltransferase involved in cell wall biosynthesis